MGDEDYTLVMRTFAVYLPDVKKGIAGRSYKIEPCQRIMK